MKRFRTLFSSFALMALAFPTPALYASSANSGQIVSTVGKLLEGGHYSRKRLDDEVSRQFLNNYLEALDHRRLYFTQKDIDDFKAKYATTLDDDILLGNPKPALEIDAVYRKRVEDRIAKIKEWIANEKFDFKSDRTININRQKANWPKDDAEADQLWHDWLENEFLQLSLAEKPDPDPKKILTRRYDQVLRFMKERSDKEVISDYLNCLAQTYDPHTDYMNPDEGENFDINMKLSLTGIGAVLQSDDGYAKVKEIVPGGPAHKDGRLKVGDRISGVAQGDEEMVDVVDMRLDKVVKQIRGDKGTTVRLEVIPTDAADPGTRSVIDIVRDTVALKDKEAKAEVIERADAHGNMQRLGWITLPSFYADLKRSRSPDAKSTTRDVRLLLERLKRENINGLVIDLRKNGGGSLDEVINLTGLFVKGTPVVQVKNAQGDVRAHRHSAGRVAYDGPLVVLTNSLSASASEIFAAAMQDYGRAVVVGDRHTFGKGTVQTTLDINTYVPFLGRDGENGGELKLTIQKFYRIAGGSTQLNGVASDIVLPSVYDQDQLGEKALKGPLPYDEVPPVEYRKVDQPLFLDDLRQRSQARVEKDPEFKYVRENLEDIRKKLEDNTLSLNEKTRREELEKQKARKKKHLAERAKRKQVEEVRYSITLENVDKSELELVKNDTPDKDAKKADDDEDDEESLFGNVDDRFDPIRNETLVILLDLIDLTKSRKTASASVDPSPAPKAP